MKKLEKDREIATGEKASSSSKNTKLKKALPTNSKQDFDAASQSMKSFLDSEGSEESEAIVLKKPI